MREGSEWAAAMEIKEGTTYDMTKYDTQSPESEARTIESPLKSAFAPPQMTVFEVAPWLNEDAGSVVTIWERLSKKLRRRHKL
jgi:hypothetical protein